MQISKRVIESATVLALALAMVITAVTSNGVYAVSDTQTAENTQLEENGLAGFAVAMNEYEVESADYLDSLISVEKEASNMVAVSAEDISDKRQAEDEADVDVETVDVEAADAPEETLSAEEQEWQDKLMADVKDFLYVRAKADADSDIVGKLYKGDRALIKKQGSEWTKIASGSVNGYVKNEYCVFGQEAYAYAKKHCDTVAKVTIDGLRVRKSPAEDAGVVKTVVTGDKFKVNKKANKTDGWVAIKVDSDTCYVSADYVTLSLDTGKAVTLEEEAAAQKAEEEKKAAAAQTASSSSSSSNGQTTTTSTTQNTSLAASADEETLLAALVQCEAGGQGVQCMTAVGAVVVNRVRSGSYPSSIYNVIYQRGQFGPASSGRLESRLASGVSSSARQAARAALSGSDPTGGAKSFKLASSGHAGVVIGPIVFY
ncbi:MAG: cell wall hydrolase [Lachnobacterium sp.]|nr:cell wall hydrolase [Lachnobacterium sp.]